MDEPSELQRNGPWRMAVWALRVGFVGVLAIVVGLVLMLSGSTAWVLAAGEIAWLVAAAVTLVGFLRARHQLPEPRPGFWSMRFMLLHDTVRAAPSPRAS